MSQSQSVELDPPPLPRSSASDSAAEREPTPAKVAGKKRKKPETAADEKSEQTPRRLRRLHEACARCRSKKIKCDSKLPSCSSCELAGAECNQEDRHRQTLKPRGHTERLETQVAQCTKLLERFIEGFTLDKLEVYLADDLSHNIDPALRNLGGATGNAATASSSSSTAPTEPRQLTTPSTSPESTPVRFVNPAPTDVRWNHPSSMAASSNSRSTQTLPSTPPSADNAKGSDPLSNNLSTTRGLIRAFGVSQTIANGLKPEPTEREDDFAGVGLGRPPRTNASTWLRQPITRRLSSVSLLTSAAEPRQLHIPADRAMTDHIVGCYFSRLNRHRPVFSRDEFTEMLDALYDAVQGIPNTKYPSIQDDSGFLCSFYLVLALGTLSEDNCRFHNVDVATMKKSQGWPSHDEFFDHALAVKPDLRVTLSSLQALILMHWYLYTERHGRTLWRLVGNLVRLAVELGLHHDPIEQNIFTPAECQHRLRLWWIVLTHDRGTSVLLGRPLAIADTEYSAPTPSRDDPSAFSEHFDHSTFLTQIQGEIVNGLYRPKKQSGDQIVRVASKIEKLFSVFRQNLPPSYRHLFTGTTHWTQSQRVNLVTSLTEDQGLTVLKYGISRILLLRALFSSKELTSDVRLRALKDAVITSHNVLIIHGQLTLFPNIAFFVSPIPIHIAAMVILYAVISRCDVLSYSMATEDVCIALKSVPLFRWRWSRKDSQGSHPLIMRLAQRVFGSDLLEGFGPTGPPVILEEKVWDCDMAGFSHASSPPDSGQQSVASTSATSSMFRQSTLPKQHGRPLPPPHKSVTDPASASMLGLEFPSLGLHDPPPVGLFYPAPLSHDSAESSDTNLYAPGPDQAGDLVQLLNKLGSSATVNGGQAEDYFVSEEFDRDIPDAAGPMLADDFMELLARFPAAAQ
ncbi:hypothetical protein BOTBODRAFT_50643 [Botryobasidium botryosum FD-172 SS1]|uniref:Zn(2)-C6 fungal-type domain-containing protein n=1 Tax=Botryobasidium botryosum (strain FD-172 SS1) TaxID=930990 RepID=A0A067N0T6_BOTB1|nr:hypothetical protein BOTBODRAFT_50643 [Botryobasidium botryosum FD-172 SS1]